MGSGVLPLAMATRPNQEPREFLFLVPDWGRSIWLLLPLLFRIRDVCVFVLRVVGVYRAFSGKYLLDLRLCQVFTAVRADGLVSRLLSANWLSAVGRVSSQSSY